MDAQIGRLLDGLRADGRWDNTLAVVTADHGEGLSDGLQIHGWGAHRVLYRQQIHVPLIVRVPGGPSGKRVDRLTRTIDIYPTVLDYLDLAAPGAVHGRSLRPLMEGLDDEPRWHYADQINGYDTNAGMVLRRPKAEFLYCIMNEEWKLIYRPTMPERSELFHIAVDPHETKDVREEHPDVYRELLAELGRRKGWVVRPFPSVGDAMTDEERQALIDAGYVGRDDGDGESAMNAIAWGWTCPEGGEVFGEAGKCSHCGEPRVLVVGEE